MASTRKTILLIAHIFPPTPGIGGRRWAKFSKYLVKRGWEVHVITAKKNMLPQKESEWTRDTQDPNILVYEVEDNYPYIYPSKHLIQKVLNLLTIVWLRLNTRGTIYDDSIFWKKNLLIKCSELLRKYRIQNLLVTGAPFHSFHHVIPLQSEFPNLQILIDYRDPWTTAVNYGMASLAPKRKRYEQQLEKEALENADVITAIIDPKILLKNSLHHINVKGVMAELPHAFDPDDFSEIDLRTAEDHRADHPIRLIYGGAMYIGTNLVIRNLSKALNELKKVDTTFYQRLEITFYTSDGHEYEELFNGHTKVRFAPLLPKGDFFYELSKAHLVLLLLADHNKNLRTTKFYEYMALRTPFLLLGANGEVSNFLKDHDLGAFVAPIDLDGQGLKRGIEMALTKTTVIKDRDITLYSYEKVTDTLIGLLK